MKIDMPDKVKYIIGKLNEDGFEAYAVGGCVRDSILGRAPKDWDITTNAAPWQVKSIFRRTVDTGIEHGTVTVMLEKEGFEVTTYRIDGKYEDNRHPSEVTFARNLADDLLRRDFTINAMAYNDTDGVVDMFGGISDLENGIIRAVGNPMERFKEDALRIMRAVRFSAELGFDIEAETFDAMKHFVPNLESISAERIRVELQKLIMGKYPEKIRLAVDSGITDVVFPEWNKTVVTAQENEHHIYNVSEHTIVGIKIVQWLTGMISDEEFLTGDFFGEEKYFVNSLKALKRNELVPDEFSEKEKQILCLTMLLHDIGKPRAKIFRGGQAHFYGHQQLSSEMSVDILKRLKYDNETISTVKVLILHHDDRFKFKWEPGTACARRLAGKIGLDTLRLLMVVQYADALSQAPHCFERSLEQISRMKSMCDEVREKNHCVTLKEMKISGRDLIGMGFEPGPGLGEVLAELLAEVIERPELNSKEYLGMRARELKNRHVSM